MDLDTVNMKTYKTFDGARPAEIITHAPQMAQAKRGKLSSETQFRADFPGYKGRQPCPPAPVEPAPTTIRLRDNNKCVLDHWTLLEHINLSNIHHIQFHYSILFLNQILKHT